jgi:hypothetical protein
MMATPTRTTVEIWLCVSTRPSCTEVGRKVKPGSGIFVLSAPGSARPRPRPRACDLGGRSDIRYRRSGQPTPRPYVPVARSLPCSAASPASASRPRRLLAASITHLRSYLKPRTRLFPQRLDVAGGSDGRGARSFERPGRRPSSRFRSSVTSAVGPRRRFLRRLPEPRSARSLSAAPGNRVWRSASDHHCLSSQRRT